MKKLILFTFAMAISAFSAAQSFAATFTCDNASDIQMIRMTSVLKVKVAGSELVSFVDMTGGGETFTDTTGSTIEFDLDGGALIFTATAGNYGDVSGNGYQTICQKY